MTEEILYMCGIIAVGFLTNYLLRALPFLVFGGRNRAIPSWIRSVSGYISPVIIGGLIVYAYSGSAWRTPWPYLAGVVTVALHLWKRNPLMSIVVGTALYMLLINCCGCTSQKLELDAQHPAIRMTAKGALFGDEYVPLAEIPEILEDYDVPRTRVIHILLDSNVKDLRPARELMGRLSKAGYTRPVLVTKQHAESINIGPAKRKTARGGSSAGGTAKRKTIRYKGANE